MRGVLDRSERDIAGEDAPWRLRPLELGDIGWIAHRQARIYHEEYGWDWTYEGLACQILGAFVLGFDPAREDAWVAERGGAIVGAMFLMKGDDPALAKLRLLHVERSARGVGPRQGAGRDLHFPGARTRLCAHDALDARESRRGPAYLSGGRVPAR